MEKIKLTAETFDNVLAMLSSPDKENVVMGLSCIEEFDITTGITYLLLIKKLANVSTDMWKEYAPQKLEYLKNISSIAYNEMPMSFQKILNLIQERKVPISDIEFFLNKFSIYMTELLKYDYLIIDSIEIKLKLKLYDTEINR